MPNNSDLGAAVLSKKLATLLALATISHVSEIMSISFHSLRFSPTAASFSLTQPKKAQHSGPLKSFVLPRFKGKCCPVECLESYVAISGEWRDPDSSAIFLSIRRPHKPVGSSTLVHWIKTCLSDAVLDPSSFSAHSTRGAAASKAVKQGIPVDTVFKTANWSRESTFQKFYHRELVGTTVTEAVLTQISSEWLIFEVTVKVSIDIGSIIVNSTRSRSDRSGILIRGLIKIRDFNGLSFPPTSHLLFIGVILFYVFSFQRWQQRLQEQPTQLISGLSCSRGQELLRSHSFVLFIYVLTSYTLPRTYLCFICKEFWVLQSAQPTSGFDQSDCLSHMTKWIHDRISHVNVNAELARC